MSNFDNNTATFTPVSDDFERRVTEAKEMRSEYLAELMSATAASVGAMFSFKYFKDLFRQETGSKFSH